MEMEEKGKQERGCGRNCLSRCCLRHQGSRFPLYSFIKINKDINGPLEGSERPLSFLNLLLEQWDDRMNRGLFHYDITTYERKVIPGEYGFIAQLIEGRDLKKRPTEFRVDKVLQPFDETKFNFMKIGQEEALFRFDESENNLTRYLHDAPISSSDSLNMIAINVSPIGYGHVLLIPSILNMLPQRIDPKSFLLTLYLSKEAGNPYFKAFYLPMLLPAEKAYTETVTTLSSGVRILRFFNYPVKGLAFKCGGDSSMKDLADAVSNACVFLQENNHPFNILISDSGMRVFLFLQCYAEKRFQGKVSQEIVENQVNPAVWEISGYMVLKRRKDYEDASEESILNFLSLVSVCDESFQELQAKIFNAIKQGES